MSIDHQFDLLLALFLGATLGWAIIASVAKWFGISFSEAFWEIYWPHRDMPTDGIDIGKIKTIEFGIERDPRDNFERVEPAHRTYGPIQSVHDIMTFSNEAEINTAEYTGDHGPIFAIGSINRYPPGFFIRGGFQVRNDPWNRSSPKVRAGISFHPHAHGIVS